MNDISIKFEHSSPINDIEITSAATTAEGTHLVSLHLGEGDYEILLHPSGVHIDQVLWDRMLSNLHEGDTSPIIPDSSGKLWLILGQFHHGFGEAVGKSLGINFLADSSSLYFRMSTSPEHHVLSFQLRNQAATYDFQNFSQEQALQKLLNSLPRSATRGDIHLKWGNNCSKKIGSPVWQEIVKGQLENFSDPFLISLTPFKRAESAFTKVLRTIPNFPKDLIYLRKLDEIS